MIEHLIVSVKFDKLLHVKASVLFAVLCKLCGHIVFRGPTNCGPDFLPINWRKTTCCGVLKQKDILTKFIQFFFVLCYIRLLFLQVT